MEQVGILWGGAMIMDGEAQNVFNGAWDVFLCEERSIMPNKD